MNTEQAQTLKVMEEMKVLMEGLFSHRHNSTNDFARRELQSSIVRMTNAIGYQRGY